MIFKLIKANQNFQKKVTFNLGDYFRDYWNLTRAEQKYDKFFIST